MLLNGNARVDPAALPPPPALSPTDALFLDFDGTLVELADRPDGVVVGAPLLALLDRLAAFLAGRVAIVSGRSIGQLDALLGDVAATIAIAGSHGAERRTPDEGHVTPAANPALAQASLCIEQFAGARSGMIAEIKSFGAALHYRACPQHEGEARAFAARLAEDHGLVLQHGKMMAEVRIAGDKGTAMRALLAARTFAGARPLFIGDDLTDEAGFVAAEACGGAGILIGDARATAARYRIDSVRALHDWLGQCAI